jgi:hypothetical protein
VTCHPHPTPTPLATPEARQPSLEIADQMDQTAPLTPGLKGAVRRAEKHAAINQPGGAAAALQALGHVVTKVRCDQTTPDGLLWDKVIGKLQALHPQPSRPLAHDFFPHPTQTEWPCGQGDEECPLRGQGPGSI